MFCYVLLLIVALYFAFRIVRNFNSLRNRIDVEKQLTEYKLVFFTNISHEFRTPLTLIQGALEKIQRVTEIPRELIYPLKTMDKSTQRMLRLINQLLEFRKMQNNKLALSLEETGRPERLYAVRAAHPSGRDGTRRPVPARQPRQGRAHRLGGLAERDGREPRKPFARNATMQRKLHLSIQ